MIAGRLFQRTAPKLGGGELKVFKEKVLLYTKLKKNIQTFKNVTMAKYLKAQERLQNRDASLNYTAKVFSDPHFAQPYKPTDKVHHLIVTTNRGTCGSLNARMVQHIGDLVQGGYDPKVVVVGKKGAESFPALVPETLVAGSTIETDHNIVHAEHLAQMLLEGQATRYRVMFTRFISVARQDWSSMTIPSLDIFIERVRNGTNAGDIIYTSWAGDTDRTGKGTPVNNARLYGALNSMSDDQLKDFYQFHVMLAINYALEENIVSELAARVVAVENQLQNISKLRDWAQSMYNKTRQANITAELLELTSAGAAMDEIMEAEAKAKKVKSVAVMPAIQRQRYLAILSDRIHELRVKVALAEAAGKDSGAEIVKARELVDQYVEWRNMLLEDEQKPSFTSVETLHQFLRSFDDKLVRHDFDERMESEIGGGNANATASSQQNTPPAPGAPPSKGAGGGRAQAAQ